jgi:hypothetical protein
VLVKQLMPFIWTPRQTCWSRKPHNYSPIFFRLPFFPTVRVLDDSVADPGSGAFFDPGIPCPFDPGIRYGYKPKILNRVRIRHEHPGSYFRELRKIVGLKIIKFFHADSESGIFFTVLWIRIRSDPELFAGSGSGVGSGINNFGSGMNFIPNFSVRESHFLNQIAQKIGIFSTYIYVHIKYVYIYICKCTHICTHTHIHIHYTYTYTHIYVCVYIYIYIYVCIYIYVNAHMYVHIYTYTYTYTYTHTNIHTHTHIYIHITHTYRIE